MQVRLQPLLQPSGKEVVPVDSRSVTIEEQGCVPLGSNVRSEQVFELGGIQNIAQDVH